MDVFNLAKKLTFLSKNEMQPAEAYKYQIWGCVQGDQIFLRKLAQPKM
jgi:hypothetical protein